MIQKQRKNFTVQIETSRTELLEAYSVIENSIVSVDLGTENLTVPEPTHIKNSIILWLADDEHCELMLSIRMIQQMLDEFKITIALTNSDLEAIEAFTFTGCRMSALQHSILSVEPASDTLIARVDLPRGSAHVEGELRASSNRDHVMKLLQVEFVKMYHGIVTLSDRDLGLIARDHRTE